MADSSRSGTMNSVICVACGLDMTETPKLRRNLGSRHKGSAIEICERVLITWKELSLTIHGQSLLIPEDSLKMCRTCFNDYDKFAVKRAGIEKNLRTALCKLNLTERQLDSIGATQTEVVSTNSNTQLLTPSRKRPSEDAHPAGIRKEVSREEPPLVLSNAATSPFASVS